MKAVILAGGNGTRLAPLTLATNKHLLSLYDKPVIYYAIEKIVEAGIDRIMIVTSPQHIENFVKLLGSGAAFKSKRTGRQIQIVYGIQNEANGLAYGLCIAKEYVGNDDCLFYLGDNIIEDDIAPQVKNFKGGSVVFLKEVADPQYFGIAELDKNGTIMSIEEKPTKPKSNLAVIGLYLYDSTVFKKMEGQKPSKRGEYEITHVNNKYIKEGSMKSVLLKKMWFDIGTFDSLLDASLYMRDKSNDIKSKK